MRRDYVTAETYVTEVNNLLSRWNEKGFGGYPTTSLSEIMECEMLVKPFKDFLDRVDALRSQLETILDAIRTYLSIRQQEQSVMMLNAIEEHEKLLKGLTWVVALFTIILVILEITKALHFLP